MCFSRKMSEFQMAFMMLLLAILILLVIMTVCRFIGLWTWTTTWIFSTKEEKLNLTKSKGHYNANGYFVSFTFSFDSQSLGELCLWRLLIICDKQGRIALLISFLFTLFTACLLNLESCKVLSFPSF